MPQDFHDNKADSSRNKLDIGPSNNPRSPSGNRVPDVYHHLIWIEFQDQIAVDELLFGHAKENTIAEPHRASHVDRKPVESGQVVSIWRFWSTFSKLK